MRIVIDKSIIFVLVMRKAIFAFLFFLLTGNGYGQSFKHFPDSAVWNIRYHYGHPPYYYFNYQLLGDTIVGGYTYKKLNGGDSLIALIREDTVQNKVYAKVFRRMTFFDNVDCSTQQTHPICSDSLLFDYNLASGDTFTGIWDSMFSGYSFKVVCVDSVYLGNVWRKNWVPGTLSNSIYSPPCGVEVIIEGIGSTSGLLETWGLGINGEISELMCFGTPSQTIYPFASSFGCSPTLNVNTLPLNDKFISIFPNPTSGIFTLQSINQQINKSTIIVSNTLGEKILERKIISERTEIDLSVQPKGIYFVKVMDGNRMAVKKIVLM